MSLEPYIVSLRRSISPLRRSPQRFAITALLVLSALLLTAAVQWSFGSGSSVLFASVVAGTTAFFGLASGLCAAGVSFLLLNYFFLDPIFQLDWSAQASRCAIGLAVLVVVTHSVERFISRRIRVPLGMHGFLDGVEDGVVSGWALDADHPSAPVTVSIFVNDSRVAEVAAVHYRPDVTEIMGCTGSHGFYVDLRDQLPNSPELRIDACYQDGNPLSNTPYFFGNTSSDESRLKTILFMHIPKTAGSSFREAIAANFRLSEIAYIYPTPPGFLVNDLRVLSWRQLRSYRVVIGHFQYGMHEALPQGSEYITMVRNPLARVLSQYAYLAECQPELVADKGGKLLPLEQVLETRLTVDFDNSIVRCFSGVDQTVFPPGTLTNEIYERAVHNLHTAFTFVGHQESADEAYAWLCRHFGWHAIPNLSVVNRRTISELGSADQAATVDAIRHCNRLDFQFYDEICKLFPADSNRMAAGELT